jgi:hypothetical protein
MQDLEVMSGPDTLRQCTGMNMIQTIYIVEKRMSLITMVPYETN